MIRLPPTPWWPHPWSAAAPRATVWGGAGGEIICPISTRFLVSQNFKIFEFGMITFQCGVRICIGVSTMVLTVMGATLHIRSDSLPFGQCFPIFRLFSGKQLISFCGIKIFLEVVM